ncbi:DUF975 family protein [Paenibacillus ginsengarvi]|uniref:DUF975 family protein n=1 Tax=Paenibacillus ginsengarvi TaxID=400777 RepID=A0A3B0CI48_9BACL|nr:DUF975 family protein [Paenibacillus ginsengarvi]RKN83967.1 DUF975 family protein [Paenibacillus ginsengarvi]
MWTREQLKTRAKGVLRTSYWKAFLASLLLAVVSGGLPSCNYNTGTGSSRDWNPFASDDFGGGIDFEWNGIVAAIIAIILLVGIVIFLAAIVFTILVRFPLEVGVMQYFKQSALDDVNLNYLGYSFGKGKYVPIVKGMFYTRLLNFLWYLLLFIPGIVKSYAYSMVPYILADNPGIGSKRAVELSNRMTRAQKWEMFVLDLSFIGWYLLGTLALLVGVLFVLPYTNATKAELYIVLRQQALDEGICSREELNLI